MRQQTCQSLPTSQPLELMADYEQCRSPTHHGPYERTTSSIEEEEEEKK